MADLPTCEECGTTDPTEHDADCSQHGLWFKDAPPLGPLPTNATGEVRMTSETGGQKGMKPQRMSLLPYPALAAISEVYGFGEKKYAAHNWRKGYNWDLSIDSLERHWGAFKEGENYDPESGLPHLAHAAFHIFSLLVFFLNPAKYGRFDTRYKPEPEKPTITINPPLGGGVTVGPMRSS